jgi:hypothetical protein
LQLRKAVLVFLRRSEGKPTSFAGIRKQRNSVQLHENNADWY